MTPLSLSSMWYTMTSCRAVKVQVSMKSFFPALSRSRGSSQPELMVSTRSFAGTRTQWWTNPLLSLSSLKFLLSRTDRMGLSDNSKLLNLTQAACRWYTSS